MTSIPVRGSVPHGYHTEIHRKLVDVASVPYRSAGRFAYGFARGKLWTDPLFIDVVRFGFLSGHRSFLDLGCGQAVFASWLLAAQQLNGSGNWPLDWPAPPQVDCLAGYELMASDVRRGQKALQPWPSVEIRKGNIINEPLPQVDAVTILDVMHYFDHAAQAKVLHKVRSCLNPGGTVVMRVGDASRGWRFELSRRVDQAVTWVRGHGWSQLYCRPVGEWVTALQHEGFAVEVMESKGGPPFANTFVVGRLPKVAARLEVR